MALHLTSPASRPGLPQACDVLFAVDPDFTLVSEAGIVLDQDADVAWPLDELNDALAHCYNAQLADPSLAPPQIYPVRSGSQTVGFVVAPRDDQTSEADLWEAFWGMLAAGGHADPDTLTFTEPTPFSCPGGWDGTEVGIVAYPVPFGPAFPAEAVNDALWRLLRQDGWPLDTTQVFLYPVRRGEGTLTGGLWLSGRVDDLDTDPLRDDVAIRAIRDLNHAMSRSAKHAARFPGFEPRRFSL